MFGASKPQRWEEWAARQYGLITRSQALAVGLSKDQIFRFTDHGKWLRVMAGVYRSASAPTTWPQPLMAATLWADGKAIASHRAAASLWELDGFGPCIELSGLVGLTPPDGIAYHRVRRLHRADVARRTGIPVTTIARTLLDLAGMVTGRTLERALDQALRTRLMRLAELRWCLERNGRRGRRDVASLELLLRDRGAFGPTDSPLESDVAGFLRKRGFPPHVRGFDLVADGRIVAQLDFAWPAQRVALLVQSAFHRDPRNYERDQMVENLLDLHGWTRVRATNKLLGERPGDLARLLWRALEGGANAAHGPRR